ncbi:unnamed protein product, partial [Discosporangium mesarthrocarpum]
MIEEVRAQVEEGGEQWRTRVFSRGSPGREGSTTGPEGRLLGRTDLIQINSEVFFGARDWSTLFRALIVSGRAGSPHPTRGKGSPSGGNSSGSGGGASGLWEAEVEEELRHVVALYLQLSAASSVRQGTKVPFDVTYLHPDMALLDYARSITDECPWAFGENLVFAQGTLEDLLSTEVKDPFDYVDIGGLLSNTGGPGPALGTSEGR